VLGVAARVRVTRRLFLEMAGVGKQNSAQVARAARCLNRPRESETNESRQIAAMIDVGMRQHDAVDALRRHGGQLRRRRAFKP
jgi:hypothetical protein